MDTLRSLNQINILSIETSTIQLQLIPYLVKYGIKKLYIFRFGFIYKDKNEIILQWHKLCSHGMCPVFNNFVHYHCIHKIKCDRRAKKKLPNINSHMLTGIRDEKQMDIYHSRSDLRLLYSCHSYHDWQHAQVADRHFAPFYVLIFSEHQS